LLSGAAGYARALEEWEKQTSIHAAVPDPSGDYEGAGDPSFMQRQNVMFSALHNQGKLGKGDKMTADLGFIRDADNLGEQIRFDTSIIKSILSDTSKTATDIVHAFNDTGLMISKELFTGLNVDARAALEQQFDDTPGGLLDGYSPPKIDDKQLEYLWSDPYETGGSEAADYIQKTKQEVEEYKNTFRGQIDGAYAAFVDSVAELGNYDWSSVMAGQIFDAQAAIAAGADTITDDVDFYADLRDQVRDFQGPDTELAGFVQNLMDAHNLLKSQQAVSIDAVQTDSMDMQPLMDVLIQHVNEVDYSGIKSEHVSENLRIVLTDALSAAGEQIPADAFNALTETVAEMTESSLRAAEVAPVSVDFEFFKMLQDHAKSVSDDVEQQMAEAKFSEEEMASAREKSAQELQVYADSMMAARGAFRAAGLDVNALTAEFAGMAGGAAALAEKTALFSEKFASREDKAGAATAESLHELNVVIWKPGLNIPETRQGFADLARELDLTDTAQASIFDTLISSAGTFDAFYASMESLSDAALSSSQKQQKAATENSAAIARVFSGIGKAVPNTRAEFAALTDSIDITTQSGRGMALMLAGNAGH
ncbi:MAG: hypothetical protein GY862_15230, partial [Gammaproteobacteria bacterium]|nr:hypothetical protein [Gammaproteobacteria bacterium]